jgi:hypothetical protein
MSSDNKTESKSKRAERLMKNEGEGSTSAARRYNQETREFKNRADIDTTPTIHVRWKLDSWHIEAPNVDGEIIFDEMVDAERRALELAEPIHANVIIHGEQDRVVAKHMATA